MKAVTCFATGAIVLLAWVSYRTAQDTYFVDLTQSRERVRLTKSGFGCGPRLGGGDSGELTQPTVALTLEIVSFDKRSYVLGDEVVCQIRLKNAGTKPVRIPWSPNSDYGNKDCTGAVHDAATASLSASLALVLTTDSGLRRGVPITSLYGRLSLSETVRVLDPGETAGMKLRGRLLFSLPSPSELTAAQPDLPLDFVATATYDLDDTSLRNPYATVISANHVELSVARAPTR